MKNLIYIFPILVLVLLWVFRGSTSVIDGDTFVQDGKYYRLEGIDSPEKGNKCYNLAKKALEKELRDLKSIVPKGYDKYDRQVVKLLDSNYQDINKRLLSTGYYKPRYTKTYMKETYKYNPKCTY